MKKLRLAVLCHQDLVPPTSVARLSEKERQPFQREYDVGSVLEELGHEICFVGVSDDLMPLRQVVEGFEPHVVVNLLLELHDEAVYQTHVASYLELLRVPYTGCDPRGLLLARDKPLAKRIMRTHRIPTPAFFRVDKGRKAHAPKRVRYPLIVKSVDEDASLGVSQNSIVYDDEALQERAEFVARNVGTDALVEEYIPGRELTVGVLGNERLTTLPVWEMSFEKLPAGSEPIATAKVKWDLAYQKKIGIETGPARELSDALTRRIQQTAKRVYRALRLSGFARIDLRMDEQEQLFVIEANATPDVSREEDLARSAAAAGLPYPKLWTRILALALARPTPGRTP